MEQIKISAKNLGAVGLEDFCPRCYWIKLKTSNKLPWQIFPGIFSSIDAYSKKAVHEIIDDIATPYPDWLLEIGPIKDYVPKVPHWSKFSADFKEFGITLNGVMDDVFRMDYNSFTIPDYKTAKYTANQDKLLPMYRIQLNGYKEIAERTSLFKPVSGLALIYFQPATDTAKGMTSLDGFDMSFDAKTVSVEINTDELFGAMKKTREIYDAPVLPDSREGCKDCGNLKNIIKLLANMPPL